MSKKFVCAMLVTAMLAQEGALIAAAAAAAETGALDSAETDSTDEATPDTAPVTSGTFGEGLAWNYDADTATLTISGEGSMGDFQNYQAAPWKTFNDEITTVMLSEGITYIGKFALSHLTKVTSIDIPSTITEFAYTAFMMSDSLTHLNVSDSHSMWYSNDGVIYDKTTKELLLCPPGRVTLDLPSDTYIGAGTDAFRHADKLQSITAANNDKGLTSIDGVLYSDADATTLLLCPGAKTTVTIPASTETIANGAFYGNDRLTTVTFEEGSQLKTIGSNAFYFCTNLTPFEFPETLESIGGYAFWNDYRWNNVTFPALVSYIGSNAFTGIQMYEGNFRFNGDAPELGEYALPSNATVHYDASKTGWDIVDGTWNGYTAKAIETQPIASGSFGDFHGAGATWSVYADGLLRISGTGAVNGYGEPYQIPWFTEYADSITAVVFDEGITSIARGVISDHVNVKTVTLPSTMSTLSGYYFQNMPSLERYIVSDANPYMKSNDDGMLLSKSGADLIAVPDTFTEATIPDGVNSINQDAFSGNTNLTSVTFNAELTHIGAHAFNGCVNLESIELPEKLTTIVGNAFENCVKLTTVTLPAAVTFVGDNAFTGTSITKVHFLGAAPSTCAPIDDDSPSFPTNATLYYKNEPESWLWSDYYDETAGTWKGYPLVADKDALETVRYYSGKFGTNDAFEWQYDRKDKALTLTGTGEMPDFINSNNVPWSAYYNEVKTVTVGEGITKLGNYALNNGRYETISIPASLTNLNMPMGFSNSSYLQNINVADGNTAYYSIDGALYRTVDTGSSTFEYLVHVPGARETFTLPANIDIVDTEAFRHSRKLTSITVEDGNTSYKAIDGALYRIDGTELVVAAPLNATSFTVPEGVQVIGSFAFSTNGKLTSVVLPSTLTTIENFAFQQCTSLKSVTIPSSVTSIGQGAFNNCYYYMEVHFTGNAPSEVYEHSVNWRSFPYEATIYYNPAASGWTLDEFGKWMGYTTVEGERIEPLTGKFGMEGENLTWSFDQTTGTLTISGTGSTGGSLDVNDLPWFKHGFSAQVRSVVFEEGVTEIGVQCIADLYNVTSVSIPASATNVEFSAFWGLRGLTSITVATDNPNYKHNSDGMLLTKDGTTLVVAPKNFVSVEIPSTVRFINRYAFDGSASLTSVTLPEYLETIDISAFRSCRNLTSILLPETVQTIDNGAFENCESLTSVRIPASVTYIAEYAFANTGLTDIQFDGNMPDGIVALGEAGQSFPDDVWVHFNPNMARWMDYYVEEGTTTTILGYKADKMNVETPDTPEPDTSTSGTFGENDSLSWSFDTSKCILTISGQGALVDNGTTPWQTYASQIKSVVISDGITELDKYCFSYMYSLETVSIPASVTFISPYAIMASPNVSGYSVDAANEYYTSENGALYNKEKTILYRVPATVTSFEMASTVKTIEYGAFMMNNYLTDINIPASVTSINNEAFGNNSNLQRFNVDTANRSFKSIDGALYNYSGSTLIRVPETIVSFLMPEGVRTVGRRAFKGCSSLEKVTFASTVTGINSAAFEGCYRLKDVSLNNGLQNISSSAFSYCESLEQIDIPATVTFISSGAFRNCNSLSVVRFLGAPPSGIYAIDAANATFPTSAVIYYSLSPDMWQQNGYDSVNGTWYGYPTVQERFIYSGTFGENGDNLSWSFDTASGELTISGSGASEYFYSTNETPWNPYRNGITSLTIKEGVTGISDIAFAGLSYLRDVSIPASLTDMSNPRFGNGASAFVTVDPNNPSFSSLDGSFYNKDRTELYQAYCPYSSFEIPEGVTTIMSNAFDGDSLTSLTIPASLTTIQNNAITFCSNIETFIIDSANTSFKTENSALLSADGKHIYYAPKNRESYEIPEGVETMDTSLFEHARELTSIKLPSTLKSISRYAFYYCPKLTSIELPDGLEEIGTYAFFDCTALTGRIDIPASVTTIGRDAFWASGITEVHFAGSAPTIQKASSFPKGTVLYYKNDAASWIYSSAYDSKNGTWNGYTLLADEGAEIPETSVSGTFGDNGNTTMTWTVDFTTKTLTLSGDGLYGTPFSSSDSAPWNKYSDMISSVVIEEGITELTAYTLWGLNKLTIITIPNSLTNIHERAIGNNQFLMGFNVSADHTAYTVYDESLYTKNLETLLVHVSSTNYLTLPSQTTKIAPYACYNNTNLRKITFSDKLVEIGRLAFALCSAITEVTFPDSLEIIEYSAFRNCEGLKSITIPANVYCVGASAFENVKGNLTKVRFLGNPPSYFYPDTRPFGENATVVYPKALESEWFASEFYSSDGTWGGYTLIDDSNEPAPLDWSFDEASGVLTITGDVEIPGYNHEEAPWYSIRESITKVIVDEGITAIGRNAFCNFDNLVSIELPSTVTKLDSNFLELCHSVQSITVSADNQYFTSVDGVLYDKSCETLVRITKAIESHTIPTTVKHIASCAAQSLDISSFTIPASIESIASDAFLSCLWLTEFNVDANNPYFSAKDGILCDKSGERLIIYPRGKVVTSIPEGIKVIGTEAFFNNNNITTLILPESITTIKNRAFGACFQLSSVTIPASVTSIGEEAFVNTDKLTNIYFKGSAPKIGSNTFYKTATLHVPADDTTWTDTSTGYDAANGTWNGYKLATYEGELTPTEPMEWSFDETSGELKITGTVEIPSYNSYNGAPWFVHKDSITSVVIEEGITGIGEMAFSNLNGLTSIHIPASVKSVSSYSFNNCYNLSAFTVAEGSKYLSAEDGVLYSYDKTRLVLVPPAKSNFAIHHNVIEIGDRFLYGNINVSNVVIPAGVEKIASTAFHGAYNLQGVTVDAANKTYSAIDSFICSKDGKTLLLYPLREETVDVPAGIEHIGSSAFWNNVSIVTLNLPDGLVSIGKEAFAFCHQLKSVTIPASVTSIENLAFKNCNNLTEIYFEGNPPAIGDTQVFPTNVTLYVPESASSWLDTANGYDKDNGTWKGYKLATYEGSAPTEAEWSYDKETFELRFKGNGAIADYKHASDAPWYQYREEIQSVIIEDGVTAIGNNALHTFTQLTTISIPASVEKIGEGFLGFTPTLESINVDTANDSYASVDGVLYDRKLTALILVPAMKATLNIEPNVDTVKEGALSQCNNLSVIHLPAKVKTIEHSNLFSSAFFTTVTVDENNPYFTAVDNVIYSKDMKTLVLSLTWCDSLTIPAGVEVIATHAFRENARLTNIVLPESLTTIEYEAFTGCRSLTSVIIPENVTSIGVSAFYNCTALADVWFNGNAPAMDAKSFNSSTILHVSADASGWTNTTLNDAANSTFMGYKLDVFKGEADIPRPMSWSIENGVLTISGEVEIPAYSMDVNQPWYDYSAEITSVVIEEGITGIGSYSLTALTELRNISIPSTVKKINTDAILACVKLEEITVASANPYYTTDDGILYSGDMKSLLLCPRTKEIVSVPEGVETITAKAFYNVPRLSAISLPVSLQSIEKYAFQRCYSLTEVTLHENVRFIGYNAFEGCNRLADVYFAGHAPSVDGTTAFPSEVTLHYRAGRTGWIDSTAYDSANKTWNGWSLVSFGDANGDGANDSVDLLRVYLSVAKVVELTADEILAADLDRDGDVDVADYKALLKKMS